MLNIEKYENVFTLNYYEFWDVNNICKYLHGKIHLEEFAYSKKPMLFYSTERYRGLEEYREKVSKLRSQFNMHELSTSDIIFSPEFYKKSEMIALGHYPSDSLFPADDLFLHEVKELYTELDNVKNIDVFGLSPYGDEDLIDKLNGMEMVTVYVFDKANNAEADIWHDSLICEHNIKDSKEIYSN